MLARPKLAKGEQHATGRFVRSRHFASPGRIESPLKSIPKSAGRERRKDDDRLICCASERQTYREGVGRIWIKLEVTDIHRRPMFFAVAHESLGTQPPVPVSQVAGTELPMTGIACVGPDLLDGIACSCGAEAACVMLGWRAAGLR